MTKSNKPLQAALGLAIALAAAGFPRDIPQPPARNSYPFPLDPENSYVGHKVCSACHPDQAKAHDASNHARTWSPVAASRFSSDTRLAGSEGPAPEVGYRVQGSEAGLVFQVALPDATRAALPVHSIIGGPRFGFSFMLEAGEIAGRPLAQPAVIEGRFMYRTHLDRFSKSPGLSPAKPESFDTAFGRVLSPSFAAKCFDCHGGIVNPVAGRELEHPVYKDTAVRCERCHGPGRLHALAAGRKDPDLRIVHPGKLPPAEYMKICGQCHSGFRKFKDPRPEDLLISAQVAALQQTRCYRESEGKIGCLLCHHPHNNAGHEDPRYVNTCLSCHGSGAARAKPCPVNERDGCTGCHMPVVQKPGSFELTDHWIRVVQ